MKTIQERVITILSRTFNCEISMEGNFSRLECNEWDSLKHFELLFSLEEEFSVRFTIEQASELNSSNDIIRVLGELDAS
jgi:acyl carrier protein